ncbi:MAG TPA: hypothetical protein VG268_13175 [Streptosporangiaceae bacterium]|nr:hypothetical protein [Streptosporangiaceae bacterium]
MSDTELIEELRLALDEATTGVWADDDLARQARSRARRRRTLRGLLASVPAAGVAAGLLVAGLPGGAAAPRVGPHPQRAAYVTSHVEAALGHTSGYIVQTTFSPAPGDTTITWLDPVSEDSRQVTSGPGGQVITWTQAETATGRTVQLQTTVDERTRTWWTTDLPGTGPVVKAPAAAAAAAAPVAASPALIMQALEQGPVTVAGQQQVDGKTAVVLRLLAVKAMAQLWVDRVTYRPVRIVFGAGTDRFVLNVAWAPRTTTVVGALSAPRVPAGYTHVTTPAP